MKISRGCNTRKAKTCHNAAGGGHAKKCNYVLTFIKNMLTHINGICLHISAKSRTFAVDKEREINLS